MTARRVILVTGPPCSGKTTYVQQHRTALDNVVDFDVIARQLGSPRDWVHSRPVVQRAIAAMRAATARVAAATEGTHWVIRCIPEGPRRQGLAQHLHADQVLLLLPSQAVLYERAQHRPAPQRTAHHIRQWLARYTPAPCDETVPSNEGAP